MIDFKDFFNVFGWISQIGIRAVYIHMSTDAIVAAFELPAECRADYCSDHEFT